MVGFIDTYTRAFIELPLYGQEGQTILKKLFDSSPKTDKHRRKDARRVSPAGYPPGECAGKGDLIVKICILASSSAGNAMFLATDRTRILIDAGLSRREIAKRLAAIG